jgi:hypothetical protein
MKSKGRARWSRRFAQPGISRATKARDADFALRCWNELAEDLILPTRDFDEGDSGDDNDDAYRALEYGHDDLEEADLKCSHCRSTMTMAMSKRSLIQSHINRKWMERAFLWTIPCLRIAGIHSRERRSILGDHPQIAPFIRFIPE